MHFKQRKQHIYIRQRTSPNWNLRITVINQRESSYWLPTASALMLGDGQVTTRSSELRTSQQAWNIYIYIYVQCTCSRRQKAPGNKEVTFSSRAFQSSLTKNCKPRLLFLPLTSIYFWVRLPRASPSGTQYAPTFDSRKIAAQQDQIQGPEPKFKDQPSKQLLSHTLWISFVIPGRKSEIHLQPEAS